MLTWAYLVLHLTGLHLSALGKAKCEPDTIPITIRVIPKVIYSDSLSGIKSSTDIPYSSSKTKYHAAHKPIYKAGTAAQNESHFPKKKKLAEETDLPDSTEKSPATDVKPAGESKTSKNPYFFLSLILLISGILITLFFRTGISLRSGIILIISGFYLLLYSLLFII